MYTVTIVYVSEPSVSIRDNLNLYEMIEAFKEWVEDDLNAYSSFFFEEKETNNSTHFFKKANGAIEKC